MAFAIMMFNVCGTLGHQGASEMKGKMGDDGVETKLYD